MGINSPPGMCTCITLFVLHAVGRSRNYKIIQLSCETDAIFTPYRHVELFKDTSSLSLYILIIINIKKCNN
jgi:hypothetical protein